MHRRAVSSASDCGDEAVRAHRTSVRDCDQTIREIHVDSVDARDAQGFLDVGRARAARHAFDTQRCGGHACTTRPWRKHYSESYALRYVCSMNMSKGEIVDVRGHSKGRDRGAGAADTNHTPTLRYRWASTVGCREKQSRIIGLYVRSRKLLDPIPGYRWQTDPHEPRRYHQTYSAHADRRRGDASRREHADAPLLRAARDPRRAEAVAVRLSRVPQRYGSADQVHQARAGTCRNLVSRSPRSKS